MSSSQIIHNSCVEITRADMKIKQALLSTGVTVAYPRTPFGGMLEQHYPRYGKGWALTTILNQAAEGLTGIKVDKVNGRVFVTITGL